MCSQSRAVGVGVGPRAGCLPLLSTGGDRHGFFLKAPYRRPGVWQHLRVAEGPSPLGLGALLVALLGVPSQRPTVAGAWVPGGGPL